MVRVKDLKFRIKEINEDGTFLGYAAVFGVVDAQGEKILPGAFKKTLIEKKKFPLLWSHKDDYLLGRVEAEEDDKGLIVKGALNLSIQKAREIYEYLKEGLQVGLSIGYKVIKDRFDKKAAIRELLEVKLYEVSLTLFPANELAQVIEVKDSESDNHEGNEEGMFEQKEKWTVAFINSLPDEAFAVIEPAYKRGETQDKRARHLPHHNKSVKDPNDDESVDLPHLRNALARVSQIKPVTDSISRSELIEKASKHLAGHAKRIGVGENAKEIEDLKTEIKNIISIYSSLLNELEKPSNIDSEKSFEKHFSEILEKINKMEVK